MTVGTSESRAGLAPVRITLDNGIVCLSKQTRTTPAVAINLAVRAGSICDPAATPGATWLLSRTIDRGTLTRSADAIAEDLDGRGITLTVSVTRHLFSLVCTCLAEDFDPVLALLGDIVMSPALSETEIAIRKGEVITAIRQDDDNPAVRASESLMALLYHDGHPYGRRTKGSIDVVESLTRDHLARLHAARFAPSQLTAVIVGDVDPARAGEVVSTVFGEWRRPEPPAVTVAAPVQAADRRRLVIPMMNKAQADIAYGFTTIRRTDPAYYAFWLMNNALGQYSIGGRLGDSIRERQGMAYYVSSALDANVAEGPLAIRAGVSPANVDRAVASIDEELRTLRHDGLAAKELDESRQYLIGSMPRALETNAGIANFLQVAELFGLGLDYDVRLPGLLRAVTLDDANAAARQAVDPDRATVVIAGPYQEGPRD
ncbi:MAG TPA: pitrilysin family protein [Vicinamibacterales bacterium]|jgi:zinc protease|nr:pitrilysin family protein [Vicinamibacterales bacterium]